MSAASFKEAGNAFLTAGKFEEAVEAYTQAIALDPTDHVFYSNRSAAYLSKGDSELALEDAVKCTELNPKWAKGYSRKGAALHAMRSYDEATEAYNAGLEIAPDDAGLKSGLAEVQKAASKPAGGGLGGLFGPQKLAGHPKFGPKLADPNFMMKMKMMQSNPQMMMQDPEMMEVLSAIIGGGMGGMGGDDEEGEEGPPYARPSASTSSASNATAGSSSYKPASASAAPKKAEDPFEGLTEEEKVVKKRKLEAIACKERGNALYKEKKFDDALAAYDEAFKIDPNMMFLNNKAAVLIEMGECDKAIALCLEAIEVGKVHRASFEDRAKVYHRMAAAHLKLNDTPAAIAAYNKGQMEQFDKAIERKVKNLELEMKKRAIEEYIDPEKG